MTMPRCTKYLAFSAIGALALTSAWSLRALAGDQYPSSASPQHHSPEPDNGSPAGEFVRLVRESTARFRDPTVAEAEGYHLMFGCVSGPDAGAMGLHYVNMSLVGDGKLDATHPEIVIYEPQPNGRLRLIGADYLVLAEAWNSANAAPPALMGQLFHLFEAPNRFGLPAFYTLHVWAWKDSPTGTFVNWNHNVSCNAYAGD
jgi:hypothetical protein